MAAVDNLLDAGDSPVYSANDTNASASRITQTVERQVSLALQGALNGEVRVVESNLAVTGISLDSRTPMTGPDGGGPDPSDITGIGFGVLTSSPQEEFSNNSTQTFFEKAQAKAAQPSAFIFVSEETVSSLSRKYTSVKIIRAHVWNFHYNIKPVQNLSSMRCPCCGI